jgi:phosphoserine phosphatase
MLTPQEEQQIQRQIDDLHKDIKELRTSLKQISDHKEQLFSQRNALGKQISTSIREIKELRRDRDALTSEVKTAKAERDVLAKQIKEKIDAFKKVSTVKKEVKSKPGVPQNPGALKQQIERLQYQIETDAPSFDKEQKIMKIIRDLEKKLKEVKKVSGMWEDTRGLSKEIDTLKDKADALHAIIQEKAKSSQQKHEKLMSLSKKVDEMKKQEAEMNKQIEVKKAELADKAKPLDEKSAKLNELHKGLGEEDKEENIKNEHQKKKKLSDLQQEVQQKLKKGGKLTTQDLIIMQSIEEK